MAFLVTYSFLHVKASLVGPNGAVIIGSDAGAAEEGISVERSEDVVTTRAGADGTPIHMLHAARLGRITVRLMKSSSSNALLSALFDADTTNPSTYGQNTIVVSWLTAGDIITGRYCGFSRPPAITYAKEGPNLEWSWNVGYLDYALGAGF
jgi:hypothetical protein